MTGLLELLAVGYALFWSALVVYSARALTHPHRKTYAYAVARGRAGDPSELPGAGRAYTTWTFKSGGYTFSVWDIPGDAGAGGPMVIMSHGWADSRLGALVRVPCLIAGASRVIVWDSRGHGDAPGVCRLGTAEVEDLLALIETIAGRGESSPLVLYGWSLGAGVSIAGAARSGAVSGVIAEAPYRLALTPARNVLRGFRLPYRLNLRPAFWILGVAFGVGPGWRSFDRAPHAAQLACPLLVIHGEDDAVCPVVDAREIAAAAGESELLVVPGAGHNNLWTEPGNAARCGAAAAAFLARVGAGTARPAGTLLP